MNDLTKRVYLAAVCTSLIGLLTFMGYSIKDNTQGIAEARVVSVRDDGKLEEKISSNQQIIMSSLYGVQKAVALTQRDVKYIKEKL